MIACGDGCGELLDPLAATAARPGCRTERIGQRIARVLAARLAGQRTAAEEPDRSCSEQCRVALEELRWLLEPVAHVDRAPDDVFVGFC